MATYIGSTEITNAYIGIPNPTSIVLDKSVISLTTVGQTEQLTATIEPTVSDKSITWTSSDTTIATVSTTGLVTCVTPGECTITATTVNGLTASCSVANNQGWQPGVNTIAYYSLDGNASDYNGIYNGTWVGTERYETLASGLNVASFPDDSILNFIETPCQVSPKTVSLWLRITTLGVSPLDWKQIIGQISSEGGAWQIRYHTSGVWVIYGSGTNKPYSMDTNWHHICITLDNSTITIFVDSVQQSQLTNATTSASGDLFIGGNNFGNNGAYKRNLVGYMSNVILENVVWTSQDISDYYNQTKSLYGIS